MEATEEKMTDIIIHDMTIDEFAEYDHEGIGYLIGTGRVNEINEQPTVDVIPVVRCKYCKWFNLEIEFGEIRIGTCPYQPPYEHTHGEGYCFRGIRRESEKQ